MDAYHGIRAVEASFSIRNFGMAKTILSSD